VRSVYASGNTIYAATNGGGLSVSTDGGLSFTSYTTANGLGSNFVNSVFIDGSTLYAATGNGLSIAQLPPPPTSAPGPLPVLGAAAAFGMARRLRQRLRLLGHGSADS
jgi:hypothetical protein